MCFSDFDAFNATSSDSQSTDSDEDGMVDSRDDSES